MRLHEPTTAITDFLLGLETFLFVVLLGFSGSSYPSQVYWIMSLILLGTAAILGGLAHGLARRSMFAIIFVCWAALMAAFILATLTDALGYDPAHAARWPTAVLATIFLIIAWRYPTSIPAFAVLEGLIMLLALGFYLALAITHAVPGAGYIAAGIATTMVAVILFLKKVQFTLIRSFDRNGVYHLVQMVAVVFFYLGLAMRI